MSVSQDIRRGLEQRLNTISGIPDIAWENTNFTPVTGTEWIRATIQFQTQRQNTRGDTGYKLHQGIFLVDIYEPQDEPGPSSGDMLADTVRAQFDPGDVITEGSTRIHIRYSERGQGINDSPWYLIPLVISWYCYNSS